MNYRNDENYTSKSKKLTEGKFERLAITIGIDGREERSESWRLGTFLLPSDDGG